MEILQNKMKVFFMYVKNAHEEIKSTGKNVKASITVLLVSNSFCPPMVSTYKKDDKIMIINIY